ncbi:AMP-binding protein [Micavibrio aeruginosavorus]|uniref:Long-chain-fatty-acid--CoA ligase n=1 Tax=Micavibrio aeruginosavorus EPB TaxID=349215 RepID=M4VHX0_9BACT|nr:AMP-binding protein [Micavibrio aeruginosavorus]AGH98803.1 Long-chain-fatty-acid--CoA ligase [Micavibrio aeruginosavorus EPB]
MIENHIRLGSDDYNRIALRDDKRVVSYADVWDKVQEKSSALTGYKCVGLALDNSVDWVLWDLACLVQGVVVVPIPPFFTKAQTQHALQSSGCDGLIKDDGISPLPFIPVDLPLGTAKITFTSGTTGTPKGVCLSSQSMLSVAQGVVDMLGVDFAGVHCSVLPLAVLLENVAGVYAALIAGATVVLPSLRSFGSQYENLHSVLSTEKATSAILVPEILRLLMGQVVARAPLLDLDFIAVGGARVDKVLLSTARSMGLPVYEGYGLSECGSVVAMNVPQRDRSGTVGTILPHVKTDIIDGEIVILNPAFLGYVGAPHAGIFKTGDLGTLDDDGFLSVTGRRKNVLITSFGRNVAPEWVESKLLSFPDIAQAFVYGDGQAHLSALIVPSRPDVEIAAVVDRVNKDLPDYARISDFSMTAPFTPADGTLTGNGRMRRDRIMATRLNLQKESKMKFYDRLVKETESARQELYAVPQLMDGIKGKISRETYIAYLTEAYHHVRHTVRFMMAMGVRLPESKKWLHDAISEYIEEEKGHEEWILNDVAAAGGDKEEARNATPNLETQVLVAYNYDYIARQNPVGFLGMVFMLESTSIQIANKGADAVKGNLGLPQTAFTYLYSHGALDIEHLKFFEDLVNKIDDPEDQAAIIEVANNTFRLFANVLRSIPHEQEVRNVA